MKKLFFILSAFLLFQSSLFSAEVLVSIAPYAYFVKKIAGSTVDVRLIVPAGASAHTYEPSPKQMMEAVKADMWFYVGEGFENKVRQSFAAHNPSMQFVDMRQNVDLISFNEQLKKCCAHHKDNYDLHYWLSPLQAKIQAKTIATSLKNRYPENQNLYENNLNIFLTELDSLNEEIKNILTKPHLPVILVSHPAYAYFCRDYGLSQLSIEVEGKDPTPKQLTTILDTAKQYGIKKIFTQVQYSNKGAKLIAREIGAEVIDLNPYAEDYTNSLLQIAKAFANN